MIDCASCGRANPPENRFCGACGAGLEQRCAACGRASQPGDAFCGGCGHALGAPAEEPAAPWSAQEPRAYTPQHLADRILDSRGAIEGERKHVTVLFADTVASTALGEEADPEVTHGLMDRCFRLILEQVHRYEGTVNQFLGDGVMALFGAPVALEDAPRGAVLAALGIQRDLEKLARDVRRERGVDFRMRIGIHSGLVVIGRIGDDLRMDYTAVGDTSNLADRLQKLAPPGSIAISDATERLTRGFFELRDLGAHEVKGKSAPVRAFEVIRARPVSGRVEAIAASGLTPLVGRERELDTLVAAFESARQGRGQVAFIVGDPGIGKSRLVHEFRRRLADEPHAWTQGRCSAYTRNTPFGPVIDAFRRDFGIEDRHSDAVALERVRESTRGLGEDMQWTQPFIQHLLSLPVDDPAVNEMDAVTRRSETFRAIQFRLLRWATQQPIVMVIEDLHWIDAASEEFLAFLADSVPGAKALLIFTHRPGYRQPFGDRSYYLRVALQALGPEEMASMVGSVLDAPSPPLALRRLIASKAEGNPFFVEEVTRSLVEEGVLRVENGRAELAIEVEDISVPDSIQDVLMARIDRLAEEPKRAIQIASVIGREFALRLLERISGAGDRLPAVVGELRALELINEKWGHPELALMFKHALTRDVAYESVLVERRKALHRIVGTAIEELYRDRLAEHYETLASHFATSEDWGRAFHYHQLAADKAAGAFANHSAAEHCRQALAIVERLAPSDRPDPEKIGQLEELLGNVTFTLNEFRTSGDAFVRAAEHAPEGAGRAANLGRAAYSYIWGHEYEPAHRTVARARELAEAVGSDSAQAIALVSEYELAMVEGRTDRDFLAEQAVAVAERSGDPEALVRALTHQAQMEEWKGRFREAIELAERAHDIGKREGLGPLTIYPAWYLGLALCGVGDYGRGLHVFHDALALCERLGDRALRARFLNSLGWCHAEFGAHERASEYNEQSTVLAGELVELGLVPSAPELYANAAINLAGNRIALGDDDGALEYLEPIRAQLDRPGDPWMRWRYSLHVLDGLGRHALARREEERALSLADQEVEGARRHRAGKLEARALELRGRALVAMDRREEAQSTLQDALALARRIGYPPVIWRATSLLAELARRSGDGPRAKELAADARGLIERLARGLPDGELRQGFGAVAKRLETTPLTAYR